MRRRQNTSILHMALQVPELLQPDPANIDDIVRRHDGRLGIRPRQRRAQRHDEREQILVQGEEPEHARRHGRGLVRLGRGHIGDCSVVRGHVRAVEMADFEHVNGDAAVVATACPLGVL